MKRPIAAVLTALLMAALLWSGARRAPESSVNNRALASSPEETDSPEARVQALLQRASEGNVVKYLDCFSGGLRDRLDREINERGREGFAEDLRRASKSRRSRAVFAAESAGENNALVTVETVYPDRNERQSYRLEQATGGWLVVEVETVRSHQPKSKFGTAASYIAPEGVPVQGVVRVETGDGPDPAAGEDPPMDP